MANGTVLTHRFEDPDSTKQLNDKWRGLFPAGVLLGFDVEVATAVGISTFTIKGASDGHGGWLSSALIGNGIMAYDENETVETLAEAFATLPLPGYVVFTVEWSESPTLAGVYEVIAQAAFDDRKHIILASVTSSGPNAVVQSRRTLQKAWPLSKLGGLFDDDAVKTILDFDFTDTPNYSMPDAAVSSTSQIRILPHGIEGMQFPDNVSYCKLTVWATLVNIEPAPGDAVKIYNNLLRNIGISEDLITVTDDYDISAYETGEYFKLIDGVDMPGLFDSSSECYFPEGGQMLKCRINRDGTAVGDTYTGRINIMCAYVEIKLKRFGASL